MFFSISPHPVKCLDQSIFGRSVMNVNLPESGISIHNKAILNNRISSSLLQVQKIFVGSLPFQKEMGGILSNCHFCYFHLHKL